jgi:hypothetical protein
MSGHNIDVSETFSIASKKIATAEKHAMYYIDRYPTIFVVAMAVNCLSLAIFPIMPLTQVILLVSGAYVGFRNSNRICNLIKKYNEKKPFDELDMSEEDKQSVIRAASAITLANAATNAAQSTWATFSNWLSS